MTTSGGSLLQRVATSWWVRLLFSAAVLWFLSTRFDMTAAVGATFAVNPLHLAAVLVLVAIDRAVMVLRWVLLLRASKVPIRAHEAASIFLVSSFIGSFLPAGIGADAARAWGLSRSAATGSDAVASVAVDRVLGVLSLVTMGAIGLVVWLPGERTNWRAGAAAGVLVGVCVLAFWADKLMRTLIPAALHGGAIGRPLLRLSDAVSRYRGHTGVLVHVMVWSIAVQVLRIVQAYLLGRGLGLTVPFQYYLLFMPVGLLMLLLPISISGFGLPQGVIVWLLRPMGVPEEQSFALTTLIILTGLAGNLPGLLLWLRK